MQRPAFYRAQAERARRVAQSVCEPQLRTNFWHLAQDLEEVAEDLERGASRFRHPDWLPQGSADD